MRIAFLWPFSKAREIMPNWRDGHRAAIEELENSHTVDWYLGDECTRDFSNYDFILMWDDGSFGRPRGKRVGLMLTTENTIGQHLSNFDVVYCESEPIKERVRALGIRAIRAMGTDTDFFSPINIDKAGRKINRDIEYFYPATFSPWKKQSKIAKLGDKLLCVGTIQPDGQEEYEACKRMGVRLEIGYFPAEKIRDYYQRSKNVVIPAIHGSERTVLEAMATNILPIVNMENKKAHSYIEEYNNSAYNSPRDFVVANYSHKKYAEALLKGINEN